MLYLAVEENQNKRSSLPVIALAAFILSAMGVVIFLYNQNQILKKELAKISLSPAPQITNSPKATPSTKWKTYTDAKYNFSISYPDNFNIFDNEKHLKDSFVGKTLYLAISTHSQEEYDQSYPSQDGTFDIIVSSIDSTPSNLDPTAYKIEKVKLFGLNATKVTVISDKYASPPTEKGSIGYFLKANGKFFSFSFPTNDLAGNHDAVYDQILASFKLPESSPTPKATITP